MIKYDNLFNILFFYLMGWYSQLFNGEVCFDWGLYVYFFLLLLCFVSVCKFMVGYEMMVEVQCDIIFEQVVECLCVFLNVYYKEIK